MCQCGCGDTNIDKGFRLPSGEIVAYDVYHGCAECFAGPGVTFYVYPNKKAIWLEGVDIEKYQPDENGGNQGGGIAVSFFEVNDLVEAAKEIGDTELNAQGYDSVEDWLSDFGLDMMQKAMQKFAERIKPEGVSK